MGPVAIVGLLIALVVVIRLIAGAMDRDRVDQYVGSRGGRVLGKQWDPFGKGWFGEQHSRLYRVRYEDHKGNTHEATCKTSLFSGVYFTEDRIIHEAGDPNPARKMESLKEENRRLREEVERLKRGDG